MTDPVNNPAHYCGHASGIECIQVTRVLDSDRMPGVYRRGCQVTAPAKQSGFPHQDALAQAGAWG
jgi:hypothetical protein